MLPLLSVAAKAAMVGSVALTSAHHMHNSDLVVKPGDTLSALAHQNHVPGGWRNLFAANRNKIKNPDLIFPAQKLGIPSHVLAATASVVVVDPNSYVVKSNDNLSEIAARFKTPGGWDSIFADNTSLSNPNALNVGMTLALQSERLEAHAQGELERLLVEGRVFSGEFPLFLANHLPMVLVAMQRLGGSPERLGLPGADAFC